MINIKELIKTLFITMLLLISVPMAAFAENETETPEATLYDEDEEDDASEDAEEEIQDAEEEILKAEERIAEEILEGSNVTLAQSLLDQAISKLDEAQIEYDLGNYETAEELAEEAKDLANEAREGDNFKSNETESDEEIEIEVEVENGEAKIKVEINDNETEYYLNSTNETEILADIALNFNLTEEYILSIWDFKIEEEENEVEEEEEDSYEQDGSILGDQFGAQMRLLQLQKRVEFQIEAGNLIIDKITELEKEDQFNMTTLDRIMTDFEGIILAIEEFDFNRTSNETAQEYVVLKKEATDLTKEFRDTVRDGLTEEDKKALREAIKEANKNHKFNKDSKIEELKAKYNKGKAKQLLQNLGINNADLQALIEQYNSGEISIDELKEKIREAYGRLDQSQKDKAKAKIAESKRKADIEAQKARKEFNENAKELREEHKKFLEEQRNELEKRNQERLKDLREEHREMMKDMKEEFEEHQKEIRELERERLKDLREHQKELAEEEEEEEIEEEEEEEEESEEEEN